MPTPLEGLKRAITKWEGGFQAQPQDAANFVVMPEGSRRLVGTMRGVTPVVLAAHRGIPAHTITAAIMKTVTLDEAAEIGLTRFYRGTGLDLLPWGPTTEAMVDFMWGSWTYAISTLQALIGVVPDKVVGPRTVEAYSRFIAKHGWEEATRRLRAARIAYYNVIIGQKPKWEGYRRGWCNRANWMTPEGLLDQPGEWWAPWAAELPALPHVPDTDAGALPKVTKPPPVLAPPDKKDDGAGLNKTLAGVAGVAGVATPIITPLMSADWKVAGIVVGGALVGGLIGWLIYREHDRGKRRQAGAEVGL